MAVKPLIRMMPTRHSPFYSPFLATHARGFPKEEGFETNLLLPLPGISVGSLLKKGEIEVSQSAISATWTELEKGAIEVPLHFAQINLRDGFLLVGRNPNSAFRWSDLEGKTLLADHGKQPLTMLRWAAHNKGCDWSKVQVIDAGSPEAMETAFRQGQADYVHLQGGVPQQMELDGAGSVVARVGEGLPALAFSSISAYPRFIESEAFGPFVRAFGKAKQWARETPAVEVAVVLNPLFPALSEAALTSAIQTCQQLGCWEGGVTIPREMYEEAQRVFLWAGTAQAHKYEEVCIAT